MKVSISIVILCLSLANTANLFADNQCISYPDQFAVDCETASPLEWDSDRSIQEIDNNNSYGHIAVKGERAQYSWTLSGQGFSFDQSGQAKSISTTTPLTTLYYTQDACGTATITVDDGCSVVIGTVKAKNGDWRLLESCGGWATYESGSRCKWGDLIHYTWYRDEGQYRYGTTYCADLQDHCYKEYQSCPNYDISIGGCADPNCDYVTIENANLPCKWMYVSGDPCCMRNLNITLQGSAKWEWSCSQ